MSNVNRDKAYGDLGLYNGESSEGVVIPQTPVPNTGVEILKKFILTPEQIEQISIEFANSLTNGLSSNSTKIKGGILEMLPTFIHDVPRFTRQGVYFALDLGGTNLRCLRINFSGNEYSFSQKECRVPAEIMTGKSQDLFDFIANILYDGVSSTNNEKDFIPYVGFTFSFPLDQVSLYSGKLVQWTKGFNIDGVEGNDIAALLKKSTEKLGLKVGEFVMINDTTGTLLSGALTDMNTMCGIINGTGTNACYIEDLKKVAKWTGSIAKSNELLINTEWGALGDSGELDFILNKYDKMIDEQSLRPKVHVLEKMMSGMYLGEVARLALIDMIEEKLIFDGVVPTALKEKESLPTSLVSDAYYLPSLCSEFKTRYEVVLKKDEAELISCLFDLIAYRSASLCSTLILELIRRCPREICHVAVDGSMFKRHPFYKKYVNRMIKQKVYKPYKMYLVGDGSGKGAAIAAAVAENK